MQEFQFRITTFLLTFVFPIVAFSQENSQSYDLNAVTPPQLDRNAVTKGFAPVNSINTEYIVNSNNNNIEKQTTIEVSGQTAPGSLVRISKSKILIIDNNNNIKVFKPSKKLLKTSAYANDSGMFKFNITLPYYKYQIPLIILPPKDSNYKKTNFLLNLNVSKEKAQMLAYKSLSQKQITKENKTREKKEKLTKEINNMKHGAWFGIGNNVTLTQQTSVLQDDNKIETFKIPTFLLKYDYRYNKLWKFNSSLNTAIGKINGLTGGQTLNSTAEYNWQILVLEAEYIPESYKYTHFGSPAEVHFMFGIHHHVLPFYKRTASSQTQSVLTTNDISHIIGGAKYILDIDTWVFEIFFRYHYPIRAGNIHTATQVFSLDGSVGTYMKYNANYRFGLFWYGQYHNYKFEHNDEYIAANPGSISNPITGDLNALFSNIEFRIGYQW